MNSKKMFMATIVALYLATPSWAVETALGQQPEVAEADMQMLFGPDNQQAQVLALSTREMRETVGARVRFNIIKAPGRDNDPWNFFKYPLGGLVTGTIAGLSVAMGPAGAGLFFDEAATYVAWRASGGFLLGFGAGIVNNTRIDNGPTLDEMRSNFFRFRR